jgi:drug/metabolite transporter (DMT)-like permease
MIYPINELAALGAALCWSITPLLSSAASSHFGALAFSRLRQISVTLCLAVVVFVTGRWQTMDGSTLLLLLVSGVIGIFVGDTLLFLGLNRLGPRRSSIVFALNAPMTAILGWLVLNETLSLAATSGIALSFAGVALAVLYGRKNGPSHKLEVIKGPLWVGLGLGLAAALGQAAGSIIARPVMAAGTDPLVAAMLRVGVAAVCLSTVMALPFDAVKPRGQPTWNMGLITVASGLLAMGLGMTLLLFALSGGKTGIIATLSATSPVMILPLLWLRTGVRPVTGAWAGAALTVVGMALLFAGR